MLYFVHLNELANTTAIHKLDNMYIVFSFVTQIVLKRQGLSLKMSTFSIDQFYMHSYCIVLKFNFKNIRDTSLYPFFF